MRRLASSPFVVWMGVLCAVIAVMATAPVATEATIVKPPTCLWVPTGWGACIRPGSHCGPGIQLRSVACKCDGKTAPDNYCKYCTTPKPATTQSCVDQSGCKYEWKYSEWCECDKQCWRHRTAKCMFGGTEVDPKKCGPSAELTQPCPDDDWTRKGRCKPHKVKCEWKTKEFCKCSKQCGGGIRTRPAARCVPEAAFLTDRQACNQCSKPNACKGPAPATSEVCNTQACKPKCSWQFTGDFCQCGGLPGQTCGDGWQTREAKCGAAPSDYPAGLTGPALFRPCEDRLGCMGQPKPEPQKQSCSLGACCEWKAEEFCKCDKECGGGTQTRPPPKCVPKGGPLLLTDRKACEACNKPGACKDDPPPTSQPCNTQACKPKCSWQFTGDFCQCGGLPGQTCGDGWQTREAKCGAVPADSSVDLTSPVAFHPCEDRWGCKDQPKPEPQRQSCDLGLCAPQCVWTEETWSTCDKDCGPGKQTRPKATCVPASAGLPLISLAPNPCSAPGSCTAPEPATEKPCNLQDCAPQCQWSDETWSTCSAECGPGTQTRPAATCIPVGVIDKVFSAVNPCAGLCLESPPATSQNCNLKDCPPQCKWSDETWSSCSAECGPGTKTRPPAQCVPVAPSITNVCAGLCQGLPAPSIQEDCNDKACPVCNWQAGEYGLCSKPCGPGKQSRSYICGLTSGSLIPIPCPDDKYCAGPKPQDDFTDCNLGICCKWDTGSYGQCQQSCTRTREVTCIPATGNPHAPGCKDMCPLPAPASTESCTGGRCHPN